MDEMLHRAPDEGALSRGKPRPMDILRCHQTFRRQPWNRPRSRSFPSRRRPMLKR